MTATIDPSACPSPFWLPGGLPQTIYGATAAHHHHIAFVRERINTPDGDFVDLDWAGPGLSARKNANKQRVRPDARLTRTAARRWLQDDDWASLPDAPDTPALILFHGLEGSSSSHYAQAIAHYFKARGWVVVVAHFRSCSGFANRMARAYYSGDSADIAFMLDSVRQRLPNAKWYAAGVSLGGNAMLKCLAENPTATHWLAASAAICAPLDLVASGNQLSSTWALRQLCTHHFLKPMKRKIMEKARRFPGTIDVLRLDRVKTLRDFDDFYTAPMHGYKNALDYWTRASSKPLLNLLQTPTLVLNSRNDPFVPAQSLPGSADCASGVLLHQPATGGHVGFTSGAFPGHSGWLLARLDKFFSTGA